MRYQFFYSVILLLQRLRPFFRLVIAMLEFGIAAKFAGHAIETVGLAGSGMYLIALSFFCDFC
jgi:hypothetical protein